MVSPSSPPQDRTEPRRACAPQDDGTSWTARFQPARDDLAALQAYVGHYLAARTDRVLYQVKKAAAWAVLGALGALAGAAMLVAAAVYLVAGIAIGLNILFGSFWAGYFVTGLVLLALMAGGAYFAVRWWLGATFDTIKKNYERRRRHERETYGWDVAQRASGNNRSRPGGPT